MMENMTQGTMDISKVQPFVYGFSMRVGPDGKPHIEKFGNTEASPFDMSARAPAGGSSEAPGGSREPLTDVIEGSETIVWLNTDGDLAADSVIRLAGAPLIGADNFLP